MADSIIIETKYVLSEDQGNGTVEKSILLEDSTTLIHEAFSVSKYKLANGATNVALVVTDACVLINPDYTFTVKYGATDATAIATKRFMYDGAAATLYLTNTQGIDIYIDMILVDES
jgi:hypothetical protein